MNSEFIAPEYLGAFGIPGNNTDQGYDVGYPDLEDLNKYELTFGLENNIDHGYNLGYPDEVINLNNPEPTFELGNSNNELEKIEKIYKYIAELSTRFKGLMNNNSSENILFKQEYFDDFVNAFQTCVRIFQHDAHKFFTDLLYTLQKSETTVYYQDWSFKDSKESANEYITEKITIRTFFERFVYILDTLAYSEKNGEIGIESKLHVMGDKVYGFCQKYLKHGNNTEVKKEITIFMTEIKDFTDQFMIVETSKNAEVEVLKKYIIDAYSIVRKISFRQKRRENAKLFDNDFYPEDYNDYQEVIKLVGMSSDHDKGKGAYFTELMYVIAQEGHKSKVNGLEDERVNVETFFQRLDRIQTNMVVSDKIPLKTLEGLKKIFIKIDGFLHKYQKDGTYPDALEVIKKFRYEHQQCMSMIDRKIKKKNSLLNFICDSL